MEKVAKVLNTESWKARAEVIDEVHVESSLSVNESFADSEVCDLFDHSRVVLGNGMTCCTVGNI